MINNVLLSEDFDLKRSLKTMILYADRVELILPTRPAAALFLTNLLHSWVRDATSDASLFAHPSLAQAPNLLDRLTNKINALQSSDTEIEMARSSGLLVSVLDQVFDSFLLAEAQSEGEEDVLALWVAQKLSLLSENLPQIMEDFPGVILYSAYQDVTKVSDLFTLIFLLLFSHKGNKAQLQSAYEQSFGGDDVNQSVVHQMASRLQDGNFYQLPLLVSLISIALRSNASFTSSDATTAYIYETVIRFRLENHQKQTALSFTERKARIAATFIEATVPNVDALPMESVLKIKDKRKEEIERFKVEVERAKFKLDPEDNIKDLEMASQQYFRTEIAPALRDLSRCVEEMKRSELRDLAKPDAALITAAMSVGCSLLQVDQLPTSFVTLSAITTAFAQRAYQLFVKLPSESESKIRQSPYALLYRLQKL